MADPTTVLDPRRGKVYTQERLHELAADESNQVYDWEYDTVERVLPPDEVELKLKLLWGYTVRNKREHPQWKWADHKRFITALEHDPNERVRALELHKMARSHPKMFDVVTHPRSDFDKDVKPIFGIIHTKRLLDAGRVTEKNAQARVSSQLQDHFKLPPGMTKEHVTPWTVSDRPD